VSDEPCIIYFVESFDASHPPENLGIPGSYQSPELILDKTVAFGCDLWALGCTLFEIRTGRKLFSPFDDDPDDCLDGMVQNLEKLPEPWWSTTCEIRSGAKTKPGRIVNTQEAEELHLVADKEKRTGFIVAIHPSVANGARSLQEKLAPGLWYLDGPVGIHHHLVGEIEKFADLLVKLLKFDLKVPLTATAAQDHEWFRI
jgi:serine/threonine protein kinase